MPAVTQDRPQAEAEHAEKSKRFNDALRTQAHCPELLHYPCGSKDRSGDILVKLQIHVPDEISQEDEQLLDQLGGGWNDRSLRSHLKW